MEKTGSSGAIEEVSCPSQPARPLLRAAAIHVCPESRIGETIERAARYRQAGANGIFVPCLINLSRECESQNQSRFFRYLNLRSSPPDGEY
jgi:2-methylisocitrate lyase-like PEP mutase family enzyme